MLLKTSKRYVLNSNRVNNPGYRVLSEGIDQSDYINNPIMLFMHYRATGTNRNEVLPIGVVKEITIDADGVMTGQPYFDSTDPFAKSLFDKYENGTLNMFSLCALPLEVSTEPEDLIPGQTGPTVTKSKLKEISAVDIGGNPDAYGVELRDENDQLIKLSDLKSTKPKITDMKLTTIGVAGILPLIKLADTATEADAIEAINQVFQLADKLEKENVILKAGDKKKDDKITELEGKLTAEIKLKDEAEMGALKTEAVNQRKVTVAEFEGIVKLADGKLDKVKEFLATKPANASIKEILQDQEGNKTELVKLSEQSWADLHKSGKLVRLKELDVNVYNSKFKEKYNKEPNA